LTSAGANVRAYDPVALEEAKHQFGDSITYCNSYLEATEGADALALITEWTEFRVPDWDKVAEAMNGKVLFDGRNLYRRETLAEIGFDYYGIGQGQQI
jgi:UDPglucose 6-dehydrogenase